MTLPIIWYLLTHRLYPPQISDVEGAREEAERYLAEEGGPDKRGRRVAAIFTTTAGLWVVGGLAT